MGTALDSWFPNSCHDEQTQVHIHISNSNSWQHYHCSNNKHKSEDSSLFLFSPITPHIQAISYFQPMATALSINTSSVSSSGLLSSTSELRQCVELMNWTALQVFQNYSSTMENACGTHLLLSKWQDRKSSKSHSVANTSEVNTTWKRKISLNKNTVSFSDNDITIVFGLASHIIII